MGSSSLPRDIPIPKYVIYNFIISSFILPILIMYIHTCLPAVTVVIDVYTHNSTLTSGDSVPLGAQLLLVCQVVGLPYGTPLSYTWTCPNGKCELEGYYGRRVYNEHILAVNTTSKSDGGTYTCQVTATGGQQANASFTCIITGMRLLHVCYVWGVSICINYNNSLSSEL